MRAVVNVFNPSMIVLAGVLAQVWRAREPLVRDALGHGMVIASLDGLRITDSQLGYDVSMLGAAELAFAPLLADPSGCWVPHPLGRGRVRRASRRSPGFAGGRRAPPYD